MLEFRIGDALIDAIYRYVYEWRSKSPGEPKHHLRIVLSPQAVRSIIVLPQKDIVSFVEFDYMASGPIKSIIGIPVEISDDVNIMTIKQV